MAMKSDWKIVKSKSDVPKGRHWVILKFRSIHIPGDERLKTNPGHGYPAHNEKVVIYKAYSDKVYWEQAISELERNYFPEEYVAAEVNPAEVTMLTQVKIK